MKKIIVFFIFLICAIPFFAKEYKTGDSFYYSYEPKFSRSYFFHGILSGVIPYESGYLLKISSLERTIELYVNKNFTFYTCEYVEVDESESGIGLSYSGWRCFKNTIVEISPNYIKVDQILIKEPEE